MRIRTDFRSLIKGYQRISYYTKNFSRYILPDALFRTMYGLKLKHLSQEELDEIGHRVDYYARCAEGSEVDSRNSVTVGGFRFPWKAKKNTPHISLTSMNA